LVVGEASGSFYSQQVARPAGILPAVEVKKAAEYNSTGHTGQGLCSGQGCHFEPNISLFHPLRQQILRQGIS